MGMEFTTMASIPEDHRSTPDPVGSDKGLGYSPAVTPPIEVGANGSSDRCQQPTPDMRQWSISEYPATQCSL